MVVGVGVGVVFCDNKAPQARIGILDFGFGLALAWVWQLCLATTQLCEVDL